MEYSVDWDEEQYRMCHESDNHWEMKKRFIRAHKEKFPEERLVCLAQCYLNVEILGCRYSTKLMQMIAELSKGLSTEGAKARHGLLQRKLISATSAIKEKVAGHLQGKASFDTLVVKGTSGVPIKLKKPMMFVKEETFSDMSQHCENFLHKLSNEHCFQLDSNGGKDPEEKEGVASTQSGKRAVSDQMRVQPKRLRATDRERAVWGSTVVHSTSETRIKTLKSNYRNVLLNSVSTDGNVVQQGSVQPKNTRKNFTPITWNISDIGEKISDIGEKTEAASASCMTQTSKAKHRPISFPAQSSAVKYADRESEATPSYWHQKGSAVKGRNVHERLGNTSHQRILSKFVLRCTSGNCSGALQRYFSQAYEKYEPLTSFSWDKWETVIKFRGIQLAKEAAENKKDAVKAAEKSAFLFLSQFCPVLMEEKNANEKAVDPGLMEGETVTQQERNAIASTVDIINEHKPLEDDNVGKKLLQMMGWSGGGLGKDKQGIAEPIKQMVSINRSGLGVSKAEMATKEGKVKLNKKIETVVDQYARSDAIHDLAFPAEFTKEERAAVHKYVGSRYRGRLQHRSYGSGASRYLVISKIRDQQFLQRLTRKGDNSMQVFQPGTFSSDQLDD